MTRKSLSLRVVCSAVIALLTLASPAANATTRIAHPEQTTKVATTGTTESTGENVKVLAVITNKYGVTTVTLSKIASTRVRGAHASPSTVRPNSSDGCNSYLANVYECFSINGSGTYVSSMVSEANNQIGYDVMMESIVKSASGTVYASSGYWDVPDGYKVTATWKPLNYEPAGTYCGGGIANDGESGYACLDVHL